MSNLANEAVGRGPVDGGPGFGSRGIKRAKLDWKLPAVGLFILSWVGMALDRRTLGGLIALPVLGAMCVPLILKVARDEKRFDLVGLMMLSFAMRMAASIPRFRGAVDAGMYHRVGVQFASSFRNLDFAVDGDVLGRVPGTGSVRYLSGLMHLITFDDFFSTLLLFAFIAFWGTWFFYRAFVLALPEGCHQRYAKLVFLWPSMVFWTSSLGKEACMTFTIGLAALGLAMAMDRRRLGFVWIGLGLAGATMIRPHMAMVFVVAMAGILLVPSGSKGSPFRAGTRVAVLVLLLVAGALVIRTTAEFLSLENLNSESVESAFDRTEARTDQGGSNFEAARVRTPTDYPWAVVTVLFRPFPMEVKSGAALLASLEGVALFAIVVVSGRSLMAVPRLSRLNSYVAFAVAYLMVFCLVFSVIGNFGILARQRTQVLPMLFVLLALGGDVAGGKVRVRANRRRTNSEVLG